MPSFLLFFILLPFLLSFQVPASLSLFPPFLPGFLVSLLPCFHACFRSSSLLPPPASFLPPLFPGFASACFPFLSFLPSFFASSLLPCQHRPAFNPMCHNCTRKIVRRQWRPSMSTKGNGTTRCTVFATEGGESHCSVDTFFTSHDWRARFSRGTMCNSAASWIEFDSQQT